MAKTENEIEVTATKKPDKGKSEEYYIEYIAKLSAQGNLFDQRTGRTRWLQGQALIEAREVCKASKKKGAWSAFLASVNMKYQTAYACIRIAERVVEAKSLTLTLTEMLAMAFDSYKRDIDKEYETDTGIVKPKTSKKPKLSEPTASAKAAGTVVMPDPKPEPKPQPTAGGAGESRIGNIIVDNPDEFRQRVDSMATDTKRLGEIPLPAADRDYCLGKLSEIVASLQGILGKLQKAA